MKSVKQFEASINPFHAKGPVLYQLKIPKNQAFLDTFRGYTNGALA